MSLQVNPDLIKQDKLRSIIMLEQIRVMVGFPIIELTQVFSDDDALAQKES